MPTLRKPSSTTTTQPNLSQGTKVGESHQLYPPRPPESTMTYRSPSRGIPSHPDVLCGTPFSQAVGRHTNLPLRTPADTKVSEAILMHPTYPNPSPANPMHFKVHLTSLAGPPMHVDPFEPTTMDPNAR